MAGVIRVSAFGTLPSGEVWSVNPIFKLTSGSVVGYSECLAVANDLVTLTPGAGLRAVMSTSTALTGFRVEARELTGTLEAQAEALRTTPSDGTGSGALPYQSALVASLRTTSTGGSGRGRLYWPATGVALTASTLRLSTTTRANFLSDMKLFLAGIEASINALIDETVALAVWSRTNDSAALVNRILAGDVVDTQRRRRDVVPESYAETSYP